MIDPIQQIKDVRAEARKVNDPNADSCFLALSHDGEASVRTLVLRDITDTQFVLFMNKTSPKWTALSMGANFQLMLWYPSQQRQYRINGTHEEIGHEVIAKNWYRRPRGSKLLDYVYKEFQPQSSRIDSRDVLVSEVQRIREQYDVDEMTAPEQATGVALRASSIETLDLNRDDRMHDRRLYTLAGNGWHEEILLP